MKKTLLLFFMGACGLQNSIGQSCTATITAAGPTTFCAGGSVVLSANAGNTWTQKQDVGGLARRGAVGFSIGTKGYIGTGATDQAGTTLTNDFWEYDSNTDTWSQKANFGGTARKNATGISIGTKGYVGLGFTGSKYQDDFWEYNPSTNTWTKKAEFKGKDRSGATGFTIGSMGYVGLGFDGKDYFKDFYSYNPSTDKWEKIKDYEGKARGNAAGFGIGTAGYVGTGNDSKVEYNDFWQYNPLTNRWISRANFAGGARSFATGFNIGNKGFIGTGFNRSTITIKNDFWEFNPLTNSWTQRIDFSGGPRFDATGFGIGSKGYLGTGSDGISVKKDFWQYNPIQTYLWSNGQTTSSITASTSGNYKVTITTNTGCVAVSNTIVVTTLANAGIASVKTGATPICSNAKTTLTALGVTGANAVVTWWSAPGGTGTNLGTGLSLPNVGPGTYYARVTASCGNAVEASATVESIPVTYSDTTASACNSFTWYDSTYKISGDYTRITTNAAGCDSVTTLHLTITSINSTFTKTDATCFGTLTGSIIITPTDGQGPYTFKIGTTAPFTTTPGEYSHEYTGLRAGTYRITIKDTLGCQGVSDQIIIGQPVAITGTTTSTNASCFGAFDGTITVTPTTGIAPYQYKPSLNGTFGPSNVLTGLRGGNYRVYIQDSNGCIGNILTSVGQPTAVTATSSKVDETCPLSQDGSVTVNGAGGTPPYQYRFGTVGAYTSTNVFSGLKAGNYRVFVKDANDCGGISIVTTVGLANTTCPSTFAKTSIATGISNNEKSLQLSLSPNPSSNQFTLKANSSNVQPVMVRVINAEGKSVYQVKGMPEQSFRFGEGFSNGLYLIEVRQGDEVKTIKAIKGK